MRIKVQSRASPPSLMIPAKLRVCCRCLSPKASCSCVYAPTILAQPFPWPRSSTSLEIPCFAPSRLRNSTQESDHRTAPEQVPRKSMIRPTVPARAGSLAAQPDRFREQGRERAGRCGRVFRLRRIACARAGKRLAFTTSRQIVVRLSPVMCSTSGYESRCSCKPLDERRRSSRAVEERRRSFKVCRSVAGDHPSMHVVARSK